MNVLILGHGYMAHALAKEAAKRGWGITDNRTACENIRLDHFWESIGGGSHPDLVVNAAAYIPASGRVTHCDEHKSETIEGNVIFPQIVSHACELSNVPLIHLSTGCLFDEAKEYEETDAPTRGWDGYCGTYVGTKLLAEKLVLKHPQTYVLRVRLPFDEVDHPRNYISKLASFPTVFDHVNSLTHRGDFAKAALDLFEIGAEPGIYHMVNPGQVSVRTLLMGMLSRSIISKCPEIEENPPVKGTLLSTAKLLATGVKIRHIDEAMAESLDNWRKA